MFHVQISILLRKSQHRIARNMIKLRVGKTEISILLRTSQHWIARNVIITLPEHPTCENLISVSASKACCVQRVLGTGGITKPTGPRRGATMQSPHFVDTRDFIWIAPAIWQTTNYNWHACRPHQLYTCTSKCMRSATSLNANLVTDMPTNPANLVTFFALNDARLSPPCRFGHNGFLIIGVCF